MIGENIRKLRLEHDMSMKDLAEKLGTTDSAICRWENAQSKITVEYVIKMADLFEISLDDLVGRKRKCD